jgi:signal transduction histidine kinase
MTMLEVIHSASTGVNRRYGSVGNARTATDTTAIPELLGFASHELRAPLSTILASTKLLELSPAARRPELIETITSEAHRMTSIVDNLLTYARLQSGHGLDAEPVLLGRTVESTVARIGTDHPRGEIRVTAEPGLVVEVDPADIELVLGNYLSNARKYGRGQPIEVEVRRNKRCAVVLVVDRGPGISDEDRDRVFEPFYRVAATAKHEPGLGIGLALCRRLVEGYGGRVWTKRRPGGGAIFGFSLSLVGLDRV